MKKQICLALLFLLICIAGAIAGNKVMFREVDINRNIAANPKIIDTLFINWTGNINTSWANPGNWSNGLVPTENDDIIIPAGTPFSPNIPNGTTANCNSIKVMAGAVISIATGGILKIRSGKSAPGTPNLITAEASLITSTSALLGGSLISIGDCALLQHGVVISTYNNPTTNQTTYPDVSINGIGIFSISVGSLLPSTKYYVRAYATNCKGTSYGNEINFTTTGGGGTTDTGYFRLTTGGITYFSFDLLSPKAATIFPEGDTRSAYVTRNIGTGEFNISSQSSFILDVSKSFGYSFGYINPDVNGTGTYSFAQSTAAGNKAIEIAIRNAVGASDATQANYNDYFNGGNFTRHLTNLTCEQTEISSLVNTLIIGRWGNPGEFIEGSISGTLYENIKTAINCSNSIAKPFVVEFKLKRLQ
jgi:hypothetical protein